MLHVITWVAPQTLNRFELEVVNSANFSVQLSLNIVFIVYFLTNHTINLLIRPRRVIEMKYIKNYESLWIIFPSSMICSQINNLHKCMSAICCNRIFYTETVMVHVESLNYHQFFSPHVDYSGLSAQLHHIKCLAGSTYGPRSTKGWPLPYHIPYFFYFYFFNLRSTDTNCNPYWCV